MRVRSVSAFSHCQGQKRTDLDICVVWHIAKSIHFFDFSTDLRELFRHRFYLFEGLVNLRVIGEVLLPSLSFSPFDFGVRSVFACLPLQNFLFPDEVSECIRKGNCDSFRCLV